MVIFSPICALKMHSSYRTHYIIFRAAGAKFYLADLFFGKSGLYAKKIPYFCRFCNIPFKITFHFFCS